MVGHAAQIQGEISFADGPNPNKQRTNVRFAPEAVVPVKSIFDRCGHY
jgi:hypothetical protein